MSMTGAEMTSPSGFHPHRSFVQGSYSFEVISYLCGRKLIENLEAINT